MASPGLGTASELAQTLGAVLRSPQLEVPNLASLRPLSKGRPLQAETRLLLPRYWTCLVEEHLRRMNWQESAVLMEDWMGQVVAVCTLSSSRPRRSAHGASRASGAGHWHPYSCLHLYSAVVLLTAPRLLLMSLSLSRRILRLPASPHCGERPSSLRGCPISSLVLKTTRTTARSGKRHDARLRR